MLTFFRQYQKIFFAVIATVVICSFVFFGTYSAMNTGPVRVDRVVGKTIDGNDLRLSEISALARVLSSDQDDLLNGQRNNIPNLINDGVIRKDILAAGLGEVLVQDNYEALENELSQRFHRIKTFRSYEHPETPFLSAKAVWQRFTPQINEKWSVLQSAAEMTKENFAQLADLYQLQSQLPAEWLRRILLMQEQQYNWLHPDPKLRGSDMALFGFHSLNDWFGKNFIDLSAEFIYNAAIAAEEKGYRVSLEETKADLHRNFAEAVKKMQAAKMPLEITFKEQVRALGLEEKELIAAWHKVLLFRKYFADVGNSVFLDRMAHEQFSTIANEKTVVDLYQWPSVLKFKDAYHLFALETYIHSVAPQHKDDLTLPTAFLPLSEIEKKAPMLVTVPYKAKVFAVDKREVALKAPIQEVWSFETEDEAWGRLAALFTELSNKPANTREERFALLQAMDPKQRAKIDAQARLFLVEKHPEWIKEALDHATVEEKSLFLSGGRIELPYIDEPAKLGALFLQIPESPELALSSLQQFEAKNAFFRFDNIEKLAGERVKTFEEAMKDHSLTKLVDQTLEAEFPKLRAKLPEEKAAKGWTFAKEELAEALLGSLKKQIEKTSHTTEGSFVSQRMALLASKALKDLQNNPEDPTWIGVSGEDPMLAQFKLQKTEKHISRTAKEDWMSKESFVLIPDQWSPIHIAEDGGVMFMYIKTRQLSQEPIIEQLTAERQILSSDVKRVLADNILRVMHRKQAVILPLQPEQE